VIVGTPGRVMDHLERGTLKLDGIRFVVLDEADEMLAMGFVDAIEAILSRTRRRNRSRCSAPRCPRRSGRSASVT